MPGQPEENTQPDAKSFLFMDAWMTSQLYVALVRKLSGSLV